MAIRWLLIPLLLLQVACAQLPPARPKPKPGFTLPIGMNLAGIADWEIGYPFRNLMWGSRKWITRNATGESPWDTNKCDVMPVDPDGYPLESPFVPTTGGQPQLPFTLIPNTRGKGRYIVRWVGDGEIECGLGSRLVSQAANRAVIELDGRMDSAAIIQLKRSNKANHVRNITVVRENEEGIDLAKDPFLPEFVQFIKPFSVLRFMDWMGTNNSLQSVIGNRKRRTSYTMISTGGDFDGTWGPRPSTFDFQQSGGVAWELIAQLCNRNGSDAWICVPHRADDDYIRQMARFFRDNLNKNRKVYLEFSNEIWNWQFEQAQWMLRDRRTGDGAAAWGYETWNPNNPTQGTGHPERIGWLFRRCFKIWEEEFTGADRARLVRVIATQHGWFDVGQRTTNVVMAHGGADALSPGGYFGPNDTVYNGWEAAGASLTTAKVLADMLTVINGESKTWTDEYAALARQHRLRYVVYEGGQHIQPRGQNDTPYMPALKAAQADPGMEDLYLRHLRFQKEAGVDLFCAFSSVGAQGTRWGSWGHAPSHSTPLSLAPKLRAILSVIPKFVQASAK